jgi:thiol-disulfide isomerase/thioredoxin
MKRRWAPHSPVTVEGDCLPAVRLSGSFAAIDGGRLRGKVVLIDIWTYTCINWLRTLPYVRAWAEKYKNQGLVVIGVHSPEFAFEKNIDNVRRAAKDMRVDYPIAIDSDFAIWRALKNQYWPALYIVDAQGRIRHHKFGEGDYEQLERIIQQLPGEAGADSIGSANWLVVMPADQVCRESGDLGSPETISPRRAENLRLRRCRIRQGPRPCFARLGINIGRCRVIGRCRKSSHAEQANGRIAYRFHPRSLHLRQGPREASVRFAC